jgi:MYXO-CTERM domain-containing protein
MKTSIAIGTLALASIAGQAYAGPVFYGTANNNATSAWTVSTKVSPIEGLASNFGVNPFTQAVNTTAAGRANWIANVPSGTNGGLGNWTYFVFRQTFDLTGYDPASANLIIRWAADDSGQVFASRGSWIPAFRLNNGSFVTYPGSSPGNPVSTYDFSIPQSITSGFVAGLNTIDFYVQGNGQTDGFALEVVSFTAAIPTPGAAALLGLGGLLAVRRRR